VISADESPSSLAWARPCPDPDNQEKARWGGVAQARKKKEEPVEDRMFEPLGQALAANRYLAWQTQFGDFTIAAEVTGGSTWGIAIAKDAITVTKGKADAARLRLKASRDAWQKFFAPVPPIGFQTIYGMFITGHLDVIGDNLHFYRYIRAIEGIFAAGRATADAPAASVPEGIEPITGRYLRLEIEGRQHRVYFEEAGEGIPLLCLHTAGSDGRQYRGLLNDPDITSRFRVITFDLPCHGKSSPPAGFQNELYLLSTDRYVATVMAVKRALQLERPVVMGCSIGGRAVLHLALRHGNEFRAAIGLQSALYAELREAEGQEGLHQIHRPDANGAEIGAIMCASLMAPQSPAADRWETLWHYMQGGPGIFMGDLHYYFVDGDLRNGALRGLDTARCPLHLLTGEYDLSATPAMTEQLAREVGATSFRVMEALGHFPMSENPAQFRKYILPVLERIREAA
jgi:pimeloyl-ACP methyl ester carboxylesterase